MLTCFPEYSSVCCKLLLLKLFFSLCLLLYLIGYPDIHILSYLFVHFILWYISSVFVLFTCRFFLLSCAGTLFLDFFLFCGLHSLLPSQDHLHTNDLLVIHFPMVRCMCDLLNTLAKHPHYSLVFCYNGVLQ